MVRYVAAVLLLTSSVQATVEASPVDANRSVSGYAVGYRKGLMERVSRNRGMPVVNCMIATIHYPLGSWVTVKGRRTGVVRSCRVTDVTKRQHVPAMRRRGIVAEFDWNSNYAVCGFKVGAEPARACPVTVSR